MIANKIVWHNIKKYDPNVITKRLFFIDKNMNGLMPLYGNEKVTLSEYAKTNKISTYEIVSLRNTVLIQKQINRSRIMDKQANQIKKDFINLVNNLNKDNTKFDLKIRHFLKCTRMPFYHVLKLIQHMPDYKRLSNDSIDHIVKISKMIYLNELDIKKRSEDFEHSLENYINKNYPNIHFRTEIDIRRDKDYNVTPDILFDEPIILEVDGKQYTIRWMDAKNYVLVNIPFIMKSLHKQATKYNDIFGMGAFVFHYGFDTFIKIPNVVILDGSFL